MTRFKRAKIKWRRRFVRLYVCQILLFLSIFSLISCNRANRVEPPDHPRLTAGVKMVDVTFHSAALNRDMQYRAVIPANIAAKQTFPVLYLLHGGAGGGFRDWSNYTDIASYTERDLIIIMPEADSSYYTNSADHPQERYEDYIVHDLISDVERRFPVFPGKARRAIAGISMGGFGAVVLALKHPDLFFFSGGMSSALDVPSRPFSIKRYGQWREHRSIFGSWGSQRRRDNDPFVLVRSADPQQAPYIFLTCGNQEGLMPANRKFAALLQQRLFHYEFHPGPGGHDWNQWNRHVPELMDSLMKHLAKN